MDTICRTEGNSVGGNAHWRYHLRKDAMYKQGILQLRKKKTETNFQEMHITYKTTQNISARIEYIG